MDAALAACVPQTRSQIHKTHREVIGERTARDYAALKPLPPPPHGWRSGMAVKNLPG
ncbi:hypothetical protein ACFV3F_34760 [Streptomyces sp. NPDC059717]|uniref:hypothetical protein n=1 Tax=Streptomyces sp. NPDC059717 TaxID=3346922 RepID=UPI003680CF75